MKKLFLFLATAMLFAGCSDEYDDSALRGEIDDLNDKVAALEQQINDLRQSAADINDELATMSAIANGIAITKVEPIADGFKITFSNGKSYEITKGAKGDKGDKGDKGEQGAPSNPLMRIDSEGYWQVSYDGGTTWEYPNGDKVSAFGATGDKGNDGAAGVTPQLSVDDAGYWIVSYDKGQTWARLKNANGEEMKAVVDGAASAPSADSNFDSVKLSADGTMLEIIMAGTTDVISVPVGGKALVAIKLNDAAIEGVQKFAKSESREYTIEAAAQYLSLIGYPEGWQAKLEAQKLTVTAPATAASGRATADSESDISILVVLNNGMATIARMEVALSEEGGTPTPDPVALATPVVTLTPASVEAGAEQAVAVAWAVVENAASYDVVFNGAAAVNVATNAYTIDAATVKALAKGEYKVSVVAKPAADATAYLQSAAGEATLTITEAAAPTPGTTKVFNLIASEVTADQLGIPSSKGDLQAAVGTSHTWTLNGVTFESFVVRSTSGDSTSTKVPVFYFYKVETAGAQTYIKSTTPLGEIVSIKMTLIDNGTKKGNVFTMMEKVGGVEQTVLSSNDNTTAAEHIYTFSAGNDGTFHFKGGDQDGKVLSFEITYKE